MKDKEEKKPEEQPKEEKSTAEDNLKRILKITNPWKGF